jgi:hypothetical protein
MPPNGGFGGNTGIQDAHNLAWKLALVLKGVAGHKLLDTYDDERRPVGALTVEQAYARYVLRTAPYLGLETVQPLVDDWAMEIGHHYRSDAILNEPDDTALAYADPFKSRGLPGTRAPHFIIEREGRCKSSIDLYGSGFVLLCGPDGDAWLNAAQQLASPILTIHQIDVPGGWRDPAGVFAEAYGISSAGAVLVRPDGFVAWRDKDPVPCPQAMLISVLERLSLLPARTDSLLS